MKFIIKLICSISYNCETYSMRTAFFSEPKKFIIVLINDVSFKSTLSIGTNMNC